MGNLRIIGGSARGIRIQSVPGDTTRPITDRVKESLFNIIGVDIVDSAFLDLFGGTGSVGIEALSRGAASVTFVDLNTKPISTIRANLLTTHLEKKAQVIQADAFRFLSTAPQKPYDYIYIAPPQYRQLWIQALNTTDQAPRLLSPDAWVIVQIHPIELEEVSLTNLVEFDRRKYGSTVLLFYRLKA
jgi:16S rRNA (guanine(966)-N(2))-methyltransferase RsmD